MAIGVMKARKRFGVEFPDLYAKESNPNKAAFDAVQRGHQNVLENIPIFLAVQAFVALAAGPLVAAGLITIYAAAKVKKERASRFGIPSSLLFFFFRVLSRGFKGRDRKAHTLVP
jgi:glutathione S-transferase